MAFQYAHHRPLTPITPIHSPHPSAGSSIRTRTPGQLSLHEYRKMQVTPSPPAVPGQKTVRKKRGMSSLSRTESLPNKSPTGDFLYSFQSLTTPPETPSLEPPMGFTSSVSPDNALQAIRAPLASSTSTTYPEFAHLFFSGSELQHSPPYSPSLPSLASPSQPLPSTSPQQPPTPTYVDSVASQTARARERFSSKGSRSWRSTWVNYWDHNPRYVRLHSEAAQSVQGVLDSQPEREPASRARSRGPTQPGSISHRGSFTPLSYRDVSRPESRTEAQETPGYTTFESTRQSEANDPGSIRQARFSRAGNTSLTTPASDTPRIRERHFNPIKRLPRPAASDRHRPLPLDLSLASSDALHRSQDFTASSSTFSLSKFPFPKPPQGFSPSQGQLRSSSPLISHEAHGIKHPLLSPASPSVRFSGVSFEIVNPHNSLEHALFDSSETQSDSSDFPFDAYLLADQEDELDGMSGNNDGGDPPRRHRYSTLNAAFHAVRNGLTPSRSRSASVAAPIADEPETIDIPAVPATPRSHVSHAAFDDIVRRVEEHARNGANSRDAGPSRSQTCPAGVASNPHSRAHTPGHTAESRSGSHANSPSSSANLLTSRARAASSLRVGEATPGVLHTESVYTGYHPAHGYAPPHYYARPQAPQARDFAQHEQRHETAPSEFRVSSYYSGDIGDDRSEGPSTPRYQARVSSLYSDSDSEFAGFSDDGDDRRISEPFPYRHFETPNTAHSSTIGRVIDGYAATGASPARHDAATPNDRTRASTTGDVAGSLPIIPTPTRSLHVTNGTDDLLPRPLYRDIRNVSMEELVSESQLRDAADDLTYQPLLSRLEPEYLHRYRVLMDRVEDVLGLRIRMEIEDELDGHGVPPRESGVLHPSRRRQEQLQRLEAENEQEELRRRTVDDERALMEARYERRGRLGDVQPASWYTTTSSIEHGAGGQCRSESSEFNLAALGFGGQQPVDPPRPSSSTFSDAVAGGDRPAQQHGQSGPPPQTALPGAPTHGGYTIEMESPAPLLANRSPFEQSEASSYSNTAQLLGLPSSSNRGISSQIGEVTEQQASATPSEPQPSNRGPFGVYTDCRPSSQDAEIPRMWTNRSPPGSASLQRSTDTLTQATEDVAQAMHDDDGDWQTEPTNSRHTSTMADYSTMPGYRGLGSSNRSNEEHYNPEYLAMQDSTHPVRHYSNMSFGVYRPYEAPVDSPVLPNAPPSTPTAGPSSQTPQPVRGYYTGELSSEPHDDYEEEFAETIRASGHAASTLAILQPYSTGTRHGHAATDIELGPLRPEQARSPRRSRLSRLARSSVLRQTRLQPLVLGSRPHVFSTVPHLTVKEEEPSYSQKLAQDFAIHALIWLSPIPPMAIFTFMMGWGVFDACLGERLTKDKKMTARWVGVITALLEMAIGGGVLAYYFGTRSH